jgi:hypothetical protein
MNTFWLKIAGLAVAVIVGVIILAGVLSGPKAGTETNAPAEPGAKSFYDVAEHDKERFLTKPQPADSNQANPQPTEQQAVTEQPPRLTKKMLREPPKPAGQVTLYFAELSEIDNVEAERLLNVAVPGRSIGRLPMTGFKLMVDNCRQIIQRWPESWYAYRAHQMLADMPERYQMRYKVTKEEMDLSRFTQPRPGTKPFVVEETH